MNLNDVIIESISQCNTEGIYEMCLCDRTRNVSVLIAYDEFNKKWGKSLPYSSIPLLGQIKLEYQYKDANDEEYLAVNIFDYIGICLNSSDSFRKFAYIIKTYYNELEIMIEKELIEYKL